MKILGYAECRKISHCRVHLGDPTQDIYEFQLYSFLKTHDFRLEQYDWFSDTPQEARLISREPYLLQLGGQYELVLSDHRFSPTELKIRCVKLYSWRRAAQFITAEFDNCWWMPTSFTLSDIKHHIEVEKDYFIDINQGL